MYDKFSHRAARICVVMQKEMKLKWQDKPDYKKSECHTNNFGHFFFFFEIVTRLRKDLNRGETILYEALGISLC